MEGAKNYLFSLTPFLIYSFRREKLFNGQRKGHNA
jgi:hypothetical protein